MAVDPPSPDSVEAHAISPALSASGQLHLRVRRFAQAALDPPLFAEGGADTFEQLALDLARFQAEHCPGFARLVQRSGSTLDRLEQIPAVTVDTFRLTRVATHPKQLDARVFRTSGTTGEHTGHHPIRQLETYRFLALGLAQRTLFGREPRGTVVALAEDPGESGSSSLSYMMQLFMAHLDGQALRRDPRGAPFDLGDPGRWLVKRGHLDLDGLRRACSIARTSGRPLFLLATSFALAGALDALDGERLTTPKRTVLMLTGGFKGRRTSLSPSELRAEATTAFGLEPGAILGEYGMTELTSQLYEGWSASAASPLDGGPRIGWWPPPGRPELYYSPPWLRVVAVDPVSGERVPQGQPGLAQFYDLGNVDSAVAVLTEDLVVEEEGGVRLLGRRLGAPERGCSLPYEGLIRQRAEVGR